MTINVTINDIATIVALVVSLTSLALMWFFYRNQYLRRLEIKFYEYSPLYAADATLKLDVFNWNNGVDVDVLSAWVKHKGKIYFLDLHTLEERRDTCEEIEIIYPTIPSLKGKLIYISFDKRSTKKIHNKMVKLYLLGNNGRKSKPVKFRIAYTDEVYGKEDVKLSYFYGKPHPLSRND